MLCNADMSAPRVVLGVVLARCPGPFAGHTCAIMNWVMGFREAGWDPFIVEHLATDELDPEGAAPGESRQEVFWRETAAEFGLQDRQCLIVNGRSDQLQSLAEFADGAELFLNYSGQFRRLDLVRGCRTRAYLDVDPAFTQIWAEGYGHDMNFEGHELFFTVGLNVNGADAALPMAGREWHPTPPPCPAKLWRERVPEHPPIDAAGAWTTVGHWYGYSELEWNGRTYGNKRDSFLAMTQLPRLSGKPCTVATDLGADWEDHDGFMAGGWRLVSALEVCADVPSYLGFIASSRGETGIAKTGYLVSRCGWVSDRSVVYLALGRPVLLHDTGWGAGLPDGWGLLAFRDAEDCARKIASVEAGYAEHSAAAAALADGELSPRTVLGRLATHLP